MKKILFFVANGVFVLALGFSGILLLSKINNSPFLKVFLVSSGSMQPRIKTGSLVFVQPQNEYKTGEIITFKTEIKSKLTTTHRIIGIGGGMIRTAGDANNNPDPKLTNIDNIVGKVMFVIPYLGYLAGFIQTPKGFILLVIVPATILIYEEFKLIFFELKDRFFRKKINLPGSKNLYLVIIPVLFSGLVFTVKSGSYFSDLEKSTGNSFTAWVAPTPTNTVAPTPTNAPTPTPTLHLIINEVSPTGDDKNEWIELYNPTSFSVNVTGWKIADALTDDTFPSISPIPSLGYAVIIGKNSNVSTIPSSAITIALGNVPIGSGLNDLGDSVTLKDPTDITVDSMSYGNIASPVFLSPPAAPSSGKSLIRHPNGVDTNTTSDWQTNINSSIGISNP